jgi:hypothetical protein
MQHDGNISRTRIRPPSAILPNIASMRSSPVDTGGQSFDRRGILRGRPATPRSGSPYCYVEQTPDALWMWHSNRAIHASIIFSILSRTRALVPTDAGIIPKVLHTCHPFMDEDVMGKNFDVRTSYSCGRCPLSISTGKGSVPDAGVHNSGVQGGHTAAA